MTPAERLQQAWAMCRSAHAKDRVDLERLFAARDDGLDVAYVRRWVHAIAGAGDARTAALEDLVRRFIAP